jgi:hypothetical protein
LVPLAEFDVLFFALLSEEVDEEEHPVNANPSTAIELTRPNPNFFPFILNPPNKFRS